MVVIIFLSVPILLIIWELVLLVRECMDNPFEASMAVDGLVFFLGALYLYWFLSYAKADYEELLDDFRKMQFA